MHKSLILIMFTTFSCSTLKNDNAYKDFGEMNGLTNVVNSLMVNLLNDHRTKISFEKIDQDRFKEKLTKQFCAELGGPCEYKGQTMARAHKGQDINQAQYYALIEILQTSMEQNSIPFSAQNKLLAKLAPMYKDIIGK